MCGDALQHNFLRFWPLADQFAGLPTLRLVVLSHAAIYGNWPELKFLRNFVTVLYNLVTSVKKGRTDAKRSARACERYNELGAGLPMHTPSLCNGRTTASGVWEHDRI